MFEEEGARPPDWEIRMPAGMKVLNANHRLHWRTAAKITKAFRETAWLLLLQQKIPTIERAYVQGVYCPPDRRVRDPANLQPTYKAIIDGLIAPSKEGRKQQLAGRLRFGLLRDDDDKHLLGPDPRLGAIVKHGQVIVRVWNLSGDVDASVSDSTSLSDRLTSPAS
ncbi:hypothetical protein ETD86_52835 [Nonomuraea turkmeniaca]|uniref:Uncharacterized protein n=1 Tax=Nonomuraea turkmeniaca TaxID=103838 RepID=A0A5S4EV45_9ACTN|nr:hypothetical protein [Nonomuraea turkmeniaca]TMR06379.1 hypothetical protein ETD86_52835 [Nonomuraea turkmeniaca]